ncbi:putative dehydrogenase [Spirosoma lacussanchae]
MEVYGQTGSVFTLDKSRMRIRRTEKEAEQALEAPATAAPAADPFAYLAQLLRGQTKPDELTSVENNLIVMEILDAARQSAKTGKAVKLQ